MALIGWAGFVVAGTVLFACVARGFGSRRIARDLAHRRWCSSLGIYLFFVKLLNVEPARGLARAAPRRRGHLTMEALQRADRRLRRRAAADEPAVGPHRRHARHLRRRAARRRPGAHRGDAAAADRQARPDRRAHHVRRHLLRRDVRRLDHHHPAQHAGRIGLDRDRARRQQDGQGRPRRPGARDQRDRLVRRRHHRHAAAHAARAAGGRRSRSSSARPSTSR